MKKLLFFLFLFSAFSSQIKSQTATNLDFDGVDDNVSCGNILTASYTKEAWVNISVGSGANNFISSGGSGQHAFWAPSTSAYMLSAGHNGNWNAVQDVNPLNFGTWYHVAVTYDA